MGGREKQTQKYENRSVVARGEERGGVGKQVMGEGVKHTFQLL